MSRCFVPATFMVSICAFAIFALNHQETGQKDHSQNDLKSANVKLSLNLSNQSMFFLQICNVDCGNVFEFDTNSIYHTDYADI